MPSSAEVPPSVELQPSAEHEEWRRRSQARRSEAEEAANGVKDEPSEVKDEPSEDEPSEERDFADLGVQGLPPSPTSPALDGRAEDGEAHPKRQRRLAEAEPRKKPAGATAEDDAREEEEATPRKKPAGAKAEDDASEEEEEEEEAAAGGGGGDPPGAAATAKPEIEVEPPQYSVTEPPPQHQPAPAPAPQRAATEPQSQQRQPAPAPAAPEPRRPPSEDDGSNFSRFFDLEAGQSLDDKIMAQATCLAGDGEQQMTSMLLSMFKSPSTRNYTASEASTAATVCDPDVTAIDPDMEDAGFWNDMQGKHFVFQARGEKGNPAAGRWQRYINGKSDASKADKAKYTKLQGQTSAQAKFRAAWLRTTFKKKLEEKMHMKQFRKRTYKDGRYLCANRITHEEGGGKQGSQNSANYCLKCLAIGAPWVTARESLPPSTLPPEGERVVWLP